MHSFSEDLLLALNDEESTNDEICLHWDRAIESIVPFANPEYDECDITNYLIEAVAPLCHAEKLEGFKRGLSFAMKFAAETLIEPDKGKMSRIEGEYRKLERPKKNSEREDTAGSALSIREIEAYHTGDPMKIGSVFDSIAGIELPPDICMVAADIARTVRKNSPADANKAASQIGTYLMRYAVYLNRNGRLEVEGAQAGGAA